VEEGQVMKGLTNETKEAGILSRDRGRMLGHDVFLSTRGTEDVAELG
jgi:hypothetical protein